jgi:hypothetical protein
LRRLLCSAEYFNDCAIFSGSFDSKISCCISNALLCSVTSADYFSLVVVAMFFNFFPHCKAYFVPYLFFFDI